MDEIAGGVSRTRLERMPLDDLRALRRLVISVYSSRTRMEGDSITAKMACLAVGETILIEGRTRYLTGKERPLAKKRLNDWTASWTSKLTTRGLRITRVA